MRKIAIVIFSIIIYFLLIFIQNNINKSEYEDAYILNKDVYRNSKVKYEDLTKVKIKSNVKYIKNIDESYYFNNNFSKNTILTEDMLTSKENKSNKNELVSIKIKSIEDAVSYKIMKDNFISIYFTCKIDSIKDNLNTINSDKYINSDDGYVSFKLFDKIKIIEMCDELGNDINEENKKVDNIVIDVKKEDALKINTLKKIGEFSLSLVG